MIFVSICQSEPAAVLLRLTGKYRSLLHAVSSLSERFLCCCLMIVSTTSERPSLWLTVSEVRV